MLDSLLDIALDLTRSLPTQSRYQRVVNAVQKVIPCDAAGILKFEEGDLVPVAVVGLSKDTLGRRFKVEEHPRLQDIMSARTPVRFAADDLRADPYDGLVEPSDIRLDRVHSCMGCSLYIGDEVVGALTVDALALGAFDNIDDKTISTLAALAAATIRTAALIEALEATAERKGLVAQQILKDTYQRGGGILLGESPVMQQLKKEVSMVAGSDLSVLVTGETGTGKELVSRTIHLQSSRATQALVHVNCAALPESIAESELFGHVRGSFTGAISDRPGKFELADGGTLFLDEVGELPLTLQPKLLRALQLGEIQRVGADRNTRVNVRIIAATNRSLEGEVKEGRFRADLYHRLSVYPIHVPPLRERNKDMLFLAGFFLDESRSRLGLGQVRMTPDARSALESYDWPGNVRELEHVILRAAVRAAEGRRRVSVIIEKEHLGLPQPTPFRPSDFSDNKEEPRARLSQAETPLSLNDAVDSFQRELIQESLIATHGNWAEAARQLKIDRGNLHRLAKRLGLK